MQGQRQPPISKFEEDIFARLNLVEREVAGQGAKLDSIQDSLDRIAKREDRPTNWPAFVTLVSVCFGVMMAIMALAIEPIKQSLAQAHSTLQARAQISNSAPEQLKTLSSDTQSQWLAINELKAWKAATERELGEVQGTFKMLEKQVDAIDNGASSYWNKENITK